MGPRETLGFRPGLVKEIARSPREGVCWSAGTADLDVNLVAWNPRHGVTTHVNDASDVLLVCLRGRGEVRVDGVPHQLQPGSVVIFPRGVHRSVLARTRLLYLTTHRRRSRTFSSEELLGQNDSADQ
jgi:quercetin dioxygenase-like cupin family protein